MAGTWNRQKREDNGQFGAVIYPRGDLVLTERDDDDEVGRSLAQVALWAGTGEDEEPLDSKYDFSDIDEDSLQAEVENVQQFWSEATELHLTDWCNKDEFTYDFWLDRNGHGTGFWDRCPNKTIGRQLSDMAKQYGHCYLLEGDDGTLSFFPG
jgi:triacylglycerol esterase/lipase EstA (alpha/beta hydrolase family)